MFDTTKNSAAIIIASYIAIGMCGLVLAADTPKVDFARDVRPILSDNCFACHGPDEPARKSALRLDRREDALADLGDYRAIVPGKPAESELLTRVSSKDAKAVMPPPKSGKKLTQRQIELLTQWIESGAQWQEHWAFVAPVRPVAPSVKNHSWVKMPIDAFVLSRLEKEGMMPASEADKVTLIRRLYLDLVGLPPEIAAVDAFVKSQDPNAYGKVVEELLASQHHGERWGRHWLDAARYADSDGYEKDKSRQVWFYRDWVVDALNRDLPYDRFIVEQLAGDLLPNPTQEQIVATGFLRNAMLNEEGGVDPEQFRMDGLFDRMDAIGKSILGLTIQCAQCHSHKFDPISHEDYYRLFAFLNNDHEAQRVVYGPKDRQKIDEIKRGLAEIDARAKRKRPSWRADLEKWEKSRPAQPRWEVIAVENGSDNSQRYITQPDGSILAQGYAPTKFSTIMRGTTKAKRITAFRLELLNDANLPCNGPGRSFMGTCALTEFTVDATDAKDPKKKASVKIVKATADYGNPRRKLEANYDDKSKKERVTGPVEYAIDGKDETAWGIDAGPGRRNVPRNAVFVPERPLEFANGVALTFNLKQNHGGWNSDDHMNNNVGRFRLSITDAADAKADPIPAGIRTVLSISSTKRTSAQWDVLFAYWRTTQPEFKSENEEAEKLWAAWPSGSTTLTLARRDAMRRTMLLERGDFLKPKTLVDAGVPSWLHPVAGGKVRPDRLGLANWLVDPKSPTTARVVVNRVWQAYFGAGLVSTSEDFGAQGERPSHPELLDWLACELMAPSIDPNAKPWSLKHLHRLIVNSSTYRQSSHVTPDQLAKDPGNRLLARASRQRVDAEVVRDIALAASGLLDRRVGGPSVYAPAPAFLFQPPASYGPFTWAEATGSERYRRALYTFRRRSTPYPALQNFDAPVGDASCVKRTRSNTPLQALTTLNESVFLDCARALAAVTLREVKSGDDARLTFAFRRCVSRPPQSDELGELRALLGKQRRRLAAGELDAWQVAAGDKKMRPELLPQGASVQDWAALTAVARVVLNLDETISRE